MSKVLVIHLKDKSTDFLKLIYKDKDYDVINEFKTEVQGREELIEAIKNHDKIIMMGHGLPSGLINPTRKGCGIIAIDYTFADLLRTKETVSIWCWSDQFFRAHKMKGFHTGMIISECSEQKFALGKVYLDKEQQLANMEKFATIVGECIDKTPLEMQKYILDHYNDNDKVTEFNRKNIIVL